MHNGIKCDYDTWEAVITFEGCYEPHLANPPVTFFSYPDGLLLSWQLVLPEAPWPGQKGGPGKVMRAYYRP